MGSAESPSPHPLDAVYRQHHSRLWKALLAYTGDADIASEAAAETFSQAVARGEAIHDPVAWIWRSAFRVAAGILADRRARLGHKTTDQWMDSLPVSASADTESLVEFLAQLGTLSDQQRAVVVLRYAGGFSPTEIATLLSTTPNTVRVQLHRAHSHLRERMEPQ